MIYKRDTNPPHIQTITTVDYDFPSVNILKSNGQLLTNQVERLNGFIRAYFIFNFARKIWTNSFFSELDQ